MTSNMTSSMTAKRLLTLSLLCAATCCLPAAHAQLSKANPKAAQPASTPTVGFQGQHVFYLSGQEQLSQGKTGFIAIAGSFTADAAGNITSGVLDKNGDSGVVHLGTLTGTYQRSSTNKGSVSLNTPSGPLSFTFYQNASYSGAYSIVAATGTILQATGQLVGENNYFQNNTYTFQLIGEQAEPVASFTGAAVITFAYGPGNAGIITGGQIQENINGNIASYPTIIGTYTTPDPTTGRFTMSLDDLGASDGAANYAMYQGAFNPGVVIFLSIDPHTTTSLLLATPTS